MNEDKEKLVARINIATNNLDRIANQLVMFDNKATFAIGFVGLVLSILFATQSIDSFFSHIESMNTLSKSLIFFSLSFVMITCFFGIFKLFMVIYPNTSPSSPKVKTEKNCSKLFFMDIIKSNSNTYINEFSNMSIEEYLEDLLNQIYLNSLICNQKVKNYKTGILFVYFSMLLAIILSFLYAVI